MKTRCGVFGPPLFLLRQEKGVGRARGKRPEAVKPEVHRSEAKSLYSDGCFPRIGNGEKAVPLGNRLKVRMKMREPLTREQLADSALWRWKYVNWFLHLVYRLRNGKRC
jgi:hypothetical protein